MSIQKINKAIHDCLAHCYRSPDVVAGMATFLEQLRASGEWKDSEILEIDAGVRHLLKGIVDEQPGSDSSDLSDL